MRILAHNMAEPVQAYSKHGVSTLPVMVYIKNNIVFILLEMQIYIAW